MKPDCSHSQHQADEQIKGSKIFNPEVLPKPQADESPLRPKINFESQQARLDEIEQHIQQSSADTLLETGRLSGKGLSRLGKLTLAVLGMLLGVETGLTLFSAWQTSYWLFGLYVSAFALALCWGGRFLWCEMTLLGRLKQTEKYREQGKRLGLSMQQGETDHLIAQLCRTMTEPEGIKAYHLHMMEEHNDAERLILFDEFVLTPLDLKARAIVRKYALESGILLAASPLAVVDMALILWRNQKMLKEIAACYGIELGYWSRLRLVKGIVTNLLYAGVTEVTMDLGSQLLSMELTGKLSARLAQGMGAGVLTARLGYQAMAVCRPLDFNKQNKPKLGKIHSELLKELTGFFKQIKSRHDE